MKTWTGSLIVQNSTVKNYLNKYTVELIKDEKQIICSTIKDYILENYWSTTFDKKQNRDKIPAKYYYQNDIHNIFYKNGKASYELWDIQNWICLFLEERYIQDVWKICLK